MYTLSRRGDFYAQPKGCSHCGLDDKTTRFQYEYFISSHDAGLDERGFVVDNLAMQNWFDSVGEFSESCELLARKAALAFAEWCKAPHKITVRIGPFNQTWVEYEYICEPEK